MANSRYSTIRPATVSPSDVEIFYSFIPNRETIPSLTMSKLEPASQYLKPYTTNSTGNEILGGLYNLTLPPSVFNQVGIYTLYIRPRQIRTRILDCSSLASLPNEKGIVLDTTGAVDNSNNPVDLNNLVDSLAGYRIEYLNSINGELSLKQNYFTIVTSANRAEVVATNQANTTQKATTYRLTDNGKLIFLTVSPNTINPVKPNIKPFIGEPSQNVILTNTNFNPIMVEIEMVNYTEEEIGIGIFGNQIRNVQNGVVTWYRDDKSIYKQDLMYEIKDEFSNPLFEVKEVKTQIDPSENFDDITSNVQ
jgi:hypothetical protein